MSSTKNLLSKQEIQESLNCLKEIFTFIEKKSIELAIPDVLKKPQISAKISESIAYYLIQKKELLSDVNLKTIQFGGSQSDILINDKIKIEIKATRKDFQYFSNKDVSCDFLIWIDFKSYFENSNHIHVYELEKPKKYYSKDVKLSLDKFKVMCGSSLKVTEFDLSSFLD